MNNLKFKFFVFLIQIITLPAFASLDLNNFALVHMAFGTYGSGMNSFPDANAVSQAKKVYQGIYSSYLNSEKEKEVTLIDSSPDAFKLICSEPKSVDKVENADCIFFGVIDLSGKNLLDYQIGNLILEKNQAQKIYLAIDKKYETPIDNKKMQKNIGNLNCIKDTSKVKNDEYSCTFSNVEFTTHNLMTLTKINEDFTEQMAIDLLIEAGY